LASLFTKEFTPESTLKVFRQTEHKKSLYSLTRVYNLPRRFTKIRDILKTQAEPFLAVSLIMTTDAVVQDSCAALAAVLQAVNAESCPHTYNFHMHTVCSDGKLVPEELIYQALSLGLKGLAITDHHSVKGYQTAQRYLQSWEEQHPYHPSPTLWSGVEISANLLGVEVHILGFAFDPEHPALRPYLLGYTAVDEHYLARRAIAAIQQAGGIAVLAHPARYKRSPTELIAAAAELGINGVETYYCYNNPVPWKPSPEPTALITELAERYQLLETCGTDTHGLNLLQRL
jgi:predicted metal-dependent phosphoesterase TrpH